MHWSVLVLNSTTDEIPKAQKKAPLAYLRNTTGQNFGVQVQSTVSICKPVQRCHYTFKLPQSCLPPCEILFLKQQKGTACSDFQMSPQGFIQYPGTSGV